MLIFSTTIIKSINNQASPFGKTQRSMETPSRSLTTQRAFLLARYFPTPIDAEPINKSAIITFMSSLCNCHAAGFGKLLHGIRHNKLTTSVREGECKKKQHKHGEPKPHVFLASWSGIIVCSVTVQLRICPIRDGRVIRAINLFTGSALFIVLSVTTGTTFT